MGGHSSDGRSAYPVAATSRLVDFHPTPIAGLYEVETKPAADARGVFVSAWERGAFAARGLSDRFDQCAISRNLRAGTLRGMHFQRPPHEQAKLVRCVRGAIYDVAVDLRAGSPTFARWHAVGLDATMARALYVPKGLAHGFLTLEDSSDVLYLLDGAYVPAASAGVRWDDPAFDIQWPRPIEVIHPRDAGFALVDVVP